MKNTLIISAFPCCGKTTVTNSLKKCYDISDSDSSNFSWLDKDKKIRNANFPNNYIEHIKSLIGMKDIIFVSTHTEVRKALEKEKIDYILIYPEDTEENKSIWLKRMINRGNSSEFIDKILSNWTDMISDMKAELFPIHYVLNYNNLAIDANVIEDLIAVCCNK